MLSEQDKYQNILTQIHELNRQNLLNENEKNDELISKIEYLTQSIETNNNKNTNNKSSLLYKILYIISGLTFFNIILSFFILFNIPAVEEKKPKEEIASIKMQENEQKMVDETIIDLPIQNNSNEVIDNKTTENENIVTFNQETIKEKEEENFKEMKPIIKKDTLYSCEDDNYTKIYKIPYTVEIKGKLYQDRFVFIVQNDKGTRKCIINKNDM